MFLGSRLPWNRSRGRPFIRVEKTAMAVHDHPDRCVLIETQSALATSSAWKVFGCDGTTEVGVPCEIIDLARPSHRPRLIVRRIEELSLIALQAAEEIALDWLAQVQDVVGPLMPRMGAVEQEQASADVEELKGLEVLCMMDPIDENAAEQLNEFKGLEVLYMMDLTDEYAAQQLTEFDGKKLKSTTKEGPEIDDENE